MSIFVTDTTYEHGGLLVNNIVNRPLWGSDKAMP